MEARVRSMAGRSVDRCENGRVRTFPDASHWVRHEREDVTEALIDHLS